MPDFWLQYVEIRLFKHKYLKQFKDDSFHF